MKFCCRLQTPFEPTYPKDSGRNCTELESFVVFSPNILHWRALLLKSSAFWRISQFHLPLFNRYQYLLHWRFRRSIYAICRNVEHHEVQNMYNVPYFHCHDAIWSHSVHNCCGWTWDFPSVQCHFHIYINIYSSLNSSKIHGLRNFRILPVSILYSKRLRWMYKTFGNLDILWPFNASWRPWSFVLYWLSPPIYLEWTICPSLPVHHNYPPRLWTCHRTFLPLFGNVDSFTYDIMVSSAKYSSDSRQNQDHHLSFRKVSIKFLSILLHPGFISHNEQV